MVDKIYVRPHPRRIKAKIERGFWSEKAIKLNPNVVREIPNRCLALDYELYQKKNGILFGRTELAGDRLDKWANHKYYIAVKEDTKEVLSYAKRVDGWFYHDFEAYDKNNKIIPDVSNVNEWKKYVVSKYGKRVRR